MPFKKRSKKKKRRQRARRKERRKAARESGGQAFLFGSGKTELAHESQEEKEA